MERLYDFLHKNLPPERTIKLSIGVSLAAIMISVISIALRLR